MSALAARDIVFFGDFRFDRCGGGLYQLDGRGGFAPVEIGWRALDLLAVLVERAGNVVSRDQIMTAVWPGLAVEDNNLNMQIAALRRVLDRGRAAESSIQTIPGRGYRFVAPVTRLDPAPAGPDVALASNSADGVATMGETKAARRPEPALAPTRRAPWRKAVTVLASAMIIIGAAVTVWNWRSPGFDAARPAPRLSIVVLPFGNLGNGPEQQYFVDGVTEDLTTDLSRVADLFVISANTAFTFKDKPPDAKEIGRELRVRYVLEGSIERSGQQIRVNAQLVDAETDAHLWAERFDRELSDLFAVQNEITARIANTLGIELVAREAARRTNNPDALDYILRGRAMWLKSNSPEVYAEAVGWFEHALALDPQSVEAKSLLARTLVGRVIDGMTDTAAADLVRAEHLVDPVLAAAPRYGYAHYVKGQLLRARGRYAEAVLEFQTALAINRNTPEALHALSMCKLLTGSIDEVIPLEEQAIRLSPRDPNIGFKYARIGFVHLLQSRTDEAIRWFEKALRGEPQFRGVHLYLASAYGLKGETERAAAELATAQRLSQDDRYVSIASLQRVDGYARIPKIQPLFDSTFFTGLRKAGMPEK